MKNITITLDEKTAAWARKHAAELEMSLSRYIGELLERTMCTSREYERAMRRYLAKRPAKLKKRRTPYPAREQIHDRDGFR
jgi:hypothetical protein